MARSGVLTGRSDRTETWTWELLVHRLDSDQGNQVTPEECVQRQEMPSEHWSLRAEGGRTGAWWQGEGTRGP